MYYSLESSCSLVKIVQLTLFYLLSKDLENIIIQNYEQSSCGPHTKPKCHSNDDQDTTRILLDFKYY